MRFYRSCAQRQVEHCSSPDIVEAILGGRQPTEMTLAMLLQRLPWGGRHSDRNFAPRFILVYNCPSFPAMNARISAYMSSSFSHCSLY